MATGGALGFIHAPFGLMRTSLIGYPFLFGLSLVAFAGVVLVWRASGAFRRTLLTVATIVCVLASTGAWVNAYFDYLPNVGAVLGQRARDQASHREFLARIAGARLRRIVVVSALPAPVRLATAKSDADDASRPVVPQGLVERVVIPGTVSGFKARAAQVYLPPAWFGTPRPQLPVIELLHGTPGAPEDWTRAGRVDIIADAYAATNHGVAPIIVMPDPNGSFTADSECVDVAKRHADSYLSIDVPQFVIAHFSAKSDPGSWAIVGSSEGGYCALMLALRHPDRYSTFADFAGLDHATVPGGAFRRLFGGSVKDQSAYMPHDLLNRPNAVLPTAGWFEVGTADDGTTRPLLKVAALAKARGIETQVVELAGAHHTWRVFHRSLVDSFPWLVEHLGLHAPERRAT